MFRLLLVGLGFFVAFAAAGYSIGRSVVTSEPYMLATIANSSSIKLSGDKLLLELRQQGSQPYWALDLAANRPTFSSAQTMLDSMNGKSLSAESNLLLTFVSGGAATTTAATVYKQVIEFKKKGDWKTFAAMVVGGVSGYLVGYYAAIKLAKPTDKEILQALRKTEMIEKVKKYVFLSLFHARGFNFDQTADEARFNRASCADVADPMKWTECYVDAMTKSGEVGRQKYRQALIRDAQEALSNDAKNLKGPEFLVFVL
jgi:hypothetical protein